MALELWDVSSNGYVEDEARRNELREFKKKDAKAIFVLNPFLMHKQLMKRGIHWKNNYTEKSKLQW